jgi:multidrug efflux pump
VVLSGVVALTLTPALCASLLQPVEAGHQHAKTGFFGWFNRGFSRTAKGYESWLGRLLSRSGRTMVVYLAVIGAAAVVYQRLPASFLPNEDQGTMLVNVQLPPGATQERTSAVMKQVEDFMLQQPEVQSMVGVLGFSFSGQGQNAALAFVTLKDWAERAAPGSSAEAVAGRAFGALMGVRDAFIFPLSPPPIPELGSASGFSFRLQDRAGQGCDALLAARNQLLGLAARSPLLTLPRPLPRPFPRPFPRAPSWKRPRPACWPRWAAPATCGR